MEEKMLSDEQLAMLSDIGQSVAFSQDKSGVLEHLIIEQYVLKNGDLYELTPKGEKALTDQAALIKGI
jgi:hypothetical protein